MAVSGKHRVIAIQCDKVRRRASAKTGLRLADGLRPAVDGPLEQFASDVCAANRRNVARPRRQPLSVLEPTQFFERIDRHVAIGANGDIAAMTQEIRQRKKSVAEIRFGARTDTDDGTGFRERLGLFDVHVRRMHQAPSVVHVEILEKPANRTPFVRRHALVDFPLLFCNVDMDWPALAGCRDFVQRQLADGPQAVCADTDAESFGFPGDSQGMVLEKCFDAQREMFLVPFGLRPVEAGTLIEDRDVAKPDAGLCRGVGEGVEHDRSGLAGRGVPMQVMEFGDARITALQHFRVGLSGDRTQQLGIHIGGQVIHALAPGPETVAAIWRTLFGVARERPLERVTVRIAHTRDNAVAQGIRVGRLLIAQNLADSAVDEL